MNARDDYPFAAGAVRRTLERHGDGIPSAVEVDSMFDEIDRLRARVAELEARP